MWTSSLFYIAFVSVLIFISATNTGASRTYSEDKELQVSEVRTKQQPVGAAAGQTSQDLNGKTTSYINNGVRAAKGSNLWHASIQKKEGNLWKHICSGALVTPNKVVTAAHCVTGSNSASEYRVGINWMDLDQDENSTDAQVIPVANITTPEQYKIIKKSISKLADIAVLMLAHDANLTNNVKTLPLADSQEVQEGVKCHIAGWGWPSVENSEQGSPFLLQGSLTVISNTLCKKYWKVIRRATKLKPKVHSTHLCALDYPGLHAGCEGDGGTPLVCDGKLVGVLSWGMIACNGCTPQCYTRVSAYSGWLNEIIHN